MCPHFLISNLLVQDRNPLSPRPALVLQTVLRGRTSVFGTLQISLRCFFRSQYSWRFHLSFFPNSNSSRCSGGGGREVLNFCCEFCNRVRVLLNHFAYFAESCFNLLQLLQPFYAASFSFFTARTSHTSLQVLETHLVLECFKFQFKSPDFACCFLLKFAKFVE